MCENLKVKSVEAHLGVEGELESIHWGETGGLKLSQGLKWAQLVPNVVIQCAMDVLSDECRKDEESCGVVNQSLQLIV